MIIDSLCPPAVLYLGFSVIQIIIDLFRGQQNSAFLKVIVMIIFTILLNQLCIGGLTILSWFIVFIPFIMMTYITTILLFVFGLSPTKGKTQPQPDPRRRHKPRPTPYNPQEVGGCAGTEFGCCPDGMTASNIFGSNCYGPGPTPQPGPQPAPSPNPHHHHHAHHYPSPSPVPPGPSPSPSPNPHPHHHHHHHYPPGPQPSPVPPGPQPSPVPPGPHHHHHHHYPPGPQPSPVPPGPQPGPSPGGKYECVIGYDGGSRSCKKTPQGTYDTLADCVTLAKCYQN